ncbi:MAG TPA: GAF domain-containing sensor histidine kinase [Acidimicrobiales bacterium]|nr:GAF domain-containing sensor histidine kinase [Acidimicrobiales bacterium]
MPKAEEVLGEDLASENRLLRRIIEVTSSDLDVREASGRVAALVTEATGSDVCFVHVVEEDRGRVVLAGATPPFDELAGTVELAIGEGIAGWVAQHGEPAVVPDKWNDDRYRYIPALRGEDYASLVSVPMLAHGRVVGVLNVHSKQQRSYGERDLALLTQVANLLARTIEKARLYNRLAEREEMLEAFAARTVEAQELERRRLSGEIHDGIGQRLVSLWYHLLAAEDAAGGDETLRHELSVAKELATAALQETRSAITGLRPSVLDDLGLAAGLESLGRSIPALEVVLDVEAGRLPAHVEVALYRIAQEALQNVVKHAGASKVGISLQVVDGTTRLTVDDDGRGFGQERLTSAEERHSYGMVGMQERAELIGATLAVDSRPGEGTTVEVIVPNER